MSDIANPIQQAIEESNLLRNKEYEIRKENTDYKYQSLQERKKQRKAFENLPIGEDVAERAKKYAQENREYIKEAKKCATFLNMDVFKDKVALFPRNIILLAAETGTGKSTTVANFIMSYMRADKKILVITNEEHVTDILNRVVFLLHGWAYTDHDSITEEQTAECDRLYPVLLSRLEIINDHHNGVGGTTTSFEGIKSICQSLSAKLAKGEKPYDAVLIDYIQNVTYSNDEPSLPQWIVLGRLMSYLDSWKNLYPAPILAFSQLKSSSNENSDFKDRLEKLRALMNQATTAIEIKIDRENLRTEWIFRKSRFKGAVGISVYTGYDKGKYIDYTQEFRQKVLIAKERKKNAELLGSVITRERK